ncbi:RTA1 like protein-domain-containing protein [Thelonectria olida]|uniref:RTA1 like protein-domain-containing protein n=1 Tax=Thelonectria olida TaxID=1576542 RepID=A0A9P8VPW8_9HYPO|nr:RTA1 like protein-domain-containing protein [Thelonectria olida]
MAVLKAYKGEIYLWLYVPSTPAAALFTALFILGTAYITWRMFKSRTWFCTAFVVGGLLEAIGYAARAAARDKTDQCMPYVIQSTFILVAPALFAASIYMILGRLIRSLHATTLSIIPIKWLTKIFVCGDVASFMVQASGAGIMVKSDSPKTGENIILGGLFIQIIIFGFFAVTAAIFHVRVRRYRTPSHSNWQQTMRMLYIVSVTIMVRSIFRVVEYIMGQDGYLLKNEWTLYVFDALLMFGVVVMLAWRYPDDLHPAKGDDLAMETELTMQPPLP